MKETRSHLERHEQVAEALAKGASISKAMVKGGYCKSRASRGMAGLPKGVLHVLSKRGHDYLKLGKQFTPEQRGEIARGALLKNVLERQDKGVRSIELLGRDTAVGIFKTDTTSVNVQINLPSGMEDMFTEIVSASKADLTIGEQ